MEPGAVATCIHYAPWTRRRTLNERKQTELTMGIRVNTACRQVIAAPNIFPERVRQAASRLTHFFGNRRFGSIGRDDFRAYAEKTAELLSETEDQSSGSSYERAADFDLLVLGTIAGFAGEIALWELIQTSLEEKPAATAETMP
jgi:hypothetical protein